MEHQPHILLCESLKQLRTKSDSFMFCVLIKSKNLKYSFSVTSLCENILHLIKTLVEWTRSKVQLRFLILFTVLIIL